MLLPSLEYLCFLTVVFLLFWILFPYRGFSLALILLANTIFLARWGWIYLLVVPICATIDYMLGDAMTGSPPHRRRELLLLSVTVNILLILSSKLPANTDWTLPLSLSFYAFQSLTYTIDIYRNDAKPAASPWTHLASVTFFPTMLAGPITRVTTLVAQWERLKTPLAESNASKALFWIAMGAAKKFLIADYLGESLVNRVFDTPALYSGLENLLAVYAYAFQLYFDFSGYTDIALGSALLVGFQLPPNFNRPYEAVNLADFWRRWHISLSNWLRDYLFFSLPGHRSAVLPYVNLVITMFLGGLWHGFTWNFTIWGLLHGLGLAGTRLWQSRRSKASASLAGKTLARIATFHYVALAWVFFRAETFGGALDVLSQVASFSAGAANLTPGFAMVLALAVIFFYLPRGIYASAQDEFLRAPALAQAVILVLLTAGIQFVGTTGAAPFVYQRF